MTIILSLLTLLTVGGPGPDNSSRRNWAPADSIGVEIRGGQRFVKHRVGPGETLSALSRRYRVSLSQLLTANPQVKSGLAVGQVVLVPRPVAAKAASVTSRDRTRAVIVSRKMLAIA